MDTLYTLLVNANNGPRKSDGVNRQRRGVRFIFPYLAPPNPRLPAQQLAEIAALIGRQTEAPHSH